MSIGIDKVNMDFDYKVDIGGKILIYKNYGNEKEDLVFNNNIGKVVTVDFKVNVVFNSKKLQVLNNV